jgi:ComEC/Rec2-related protein
MHREILYGIWIYTLAAVVIARVVLCQPKDAEPGLVVDQAVTIVEFPTVKKTQQVLRVRLQQKDVSPITIYASRYPEFEIRDVVHIQGTIGKNNTVSRPIIKKIGNSSNQIESAVFKVRAHLVRVIQKTVPEPHASLVLGMLLGVESNIPEKLADELKKTGTIHMLVVSGFNVTLVAGAALRLAGVIHRNTATIVALLAIAGFIVLTGAQPPVVRAGCMTALVMLAQVYGRPTVARYTLLLTVAILLAVYPDLFYSLSFQLSVAATAGIVLVSQVKQGVTEEKSNSERGMKPYILAELKTSIAAQAAVAPLLLNSFGSISLVAPIVNVLIAWTVPYIMFGGLVVSILGSISQQAGQLASIFVVPLTTFFIWGVEVGGKIPFGWVENLQINLVILYGIYMLLVSTIVRLNTDKIYPKDQI